MSRDLKIFTNNIEEKAKNQIDLLLNQEAFKDCKIRIMPDVHAGKGCVIGFTGNLGDKVIPNIVGVDIGCGIFCANLGKIDVDYKKLDDFINENIPSGMNVNKEEIEPFDLDKLICYKELSDYEWIKNSLGSLGGGNHFIEIDESEDKEKYLVIHTGSRNLGAQVAKLYQDKADKEEIKNRSLDIINEYKKQGRFKEIESVLSAYKEKYKEEKNKASRDLKYLENKERDNYLHDMKICQEYAIRNRLLIAKRITSYMGWKLDDYFESIHNYISFEDNIVRKGAISAKKNERVIIPINMRDGCILGTGKGNEDWNTSAPHGAGRIMSRMKATQEIKMEDYKKSMEGIYTTSVSQGTLDESPFVYKPKEEIIENIKPTVDINKIIKSVYNFKAEENRRR